MKNLQRYLALLKKLVRIYFSHQPRKDLEYRKVIFYTFKEWGGVYIKFLQILAGMSKFMDGWGGPREMEVFAQAPREPLNVTEYIDIKNFAEISPEPIAAGSFALVYRGKLVSGEDVAIKILRPSIRDNLQKDLKTLGHLCKFFSKFLPQYLIDYNEAYAACAQMFLLETDYEREMTNQKYFAEFYHNHPRVVIPKVYTELSSKSVIVQDFIAGPTLADVMSMATREKSATEIAHELTGSDLWEQVVVAGGEALFTAMCADYVYGDPHPGNIVLLSDNRIGLIDFGVIANQPSSHMAFHDWVESYYEILNGQDCFHQLLETTVTCFCPDISLAMQRCNFDDGNLLNILASAITEKLSVEMSGNQNFIQKFQDGHLMDVLLQVVGTKVLSVNVATVNFELIKAMQAFLGAVTILDNSEERHGFSAIMLRSMDYALAGAEKVGVKHDMIYQTHYSLTESYELLINTISSLADNDEIMFELVKERIFA